MKNSIIINIIFSFLLEMWLHGNWDQREGSMGIRDMTILAGRLLNQSVTGYTATTAIHPLLYAINYFETDSQLCSLKVNLKFGLIEKWARLKSGQKKFVIITTTCVIFAYGIRF